MSWGVLSKTFSASTYLKLAFIASIKSTLESKNLDSDPHLRLVENFKDDQQDD